MLTVNVSPPEIIADTKAAAECAGLTYVSDSSPGIRRKRRGKGFRYTDVRGGTVRDAATLKRIRGIVIPPAWTDVWICPDPDGHIQAPAGTREAGSNTDIILVSASCASRRNTNR